MSRQNTREMKRSRSMERATRKAKSARRIPFGGILRMKDKAPLNRITNSPSKAPTYTPADLFRQLAKAFVDMAPDRVEHGKPRLAELLTWLYVPHGMSVWKIIKAPTKSEARAKLKKLFGVSSTRYFTFAHGATV